jgi:hypothetical protein
VRLSSPSAVALQTEASPSNFVFGGSHLGWGLIALLCAGALALVVGPLLMTSGRRSRNSGTTQPAAESPPSAPPPSDSP